MTAASETASPFTTTVESPEQWKRVVHVEIERAHFDAEYAKNLRKARKDYARPGFRKGKAPIEMVDADMGNEVRMNTLDQIMPKAYQAAMIEHKFWPVTDPQLEDLKMEEGEPVKLDLSVEVRPEVEAKDYDDLPLTERTAELEDGAVDEAIERVRESKAVWETVERKAETGDQAVVNITPLGDDGEPEEDKKVPDYQFDVGAENNFEVFNEALDGAAAGDVREAVVTYPDDYSTESLKGKTMTFRLEVTEVKAKTLPELDDAFANSINDGQTLLELRKNMRDELMAEQERRVEHEAREQITDLLLERNDIAVPPTMVDDYVASSTEEMKQRARMYGQEMNDEQIKGYRESARPDAERTLRAMFLLESIRKQEEIKVSDESVDERIEEIAAENKFPAAQYREYLEKNGELDRVSHELAERMTFDFLKSRAKFTEAAE
jgi:trigger factor